MWKFRYFVLAIQTLFWKWSKLFVKDPARPIPPLYQNFCVLLIERQFCSYFSVTFFFNNRQQPAPMECIQLNEDIVSWPNIGPVYPSTLLKRKPFRSYHILTLSVINLVDRVSLLPAPFSFARTLQGAGRRGILGIRLICDQLLNRRTVTFVKVIWPDADEVGSDKAKTLHFSRSIKQIILMVQNTFLSITPKHSTCTAESKFLQI